DVMAPGKGKKCSLCTKILEQIKAMAGDDPDEETVEAVLGKVCRSLGRLIRGFCKRLVKKYQDQISDALQNGDQPKDICAAINFCKA
ncbi:NKL protein, partial [Sula dactylatra]|nr:NKL protein [Sula dactylatra]